MDLNIPARILAKRLNARAGRYSIYRAANAEPDADHFEFW